MASNLPIEWKSRLLCADYASSIFEYFKPLMYKGLNSAARRLMRHTRSYRFSQSNQRPIFSFGSLYTPSDNYNPNQWRTFSSQHPSHDLKSHMQN